MKSLTKAQIKEAIAKLNAENDARKVSCADRRMFYKAKVQPLQDELIKRYEEERAGKYRETISDFQI